MTNIDPNTGLPELPEGYFWRVDQPLSLPKKEYPIYGGYTPRPTPDKSRLRIYLVQTIKGSNKVRQYRGKNRFTRWITANETVQVDASFEREVTRYGEDCKGRNAIAVRNAAKRIMKRWNADKEASKLVGDYPPKKLEA